jgi:hypothetical protein
MTLQPEAIELIARADDFQVMKAFALVHDMVLNSLPPSTGAMDIQVHAELETIDDYDVRAWIASKSEEVVGERNSRQLMREVLVLAANDPQLCGYVTAAFSQIEDNRQFIAETLTIGAVGAIWMVAAGLELDLNTPWGQVKKSADPRLIKALAELARGLWGRQ